MFATRVVAAVLSLAVIPVAAQARQVDVRVRIGNPPPPPPVYVPAPAPVVVVPPPVVIPAPPVVAAPSVPLLAPSQLDGLTGPIALYPDPLLAQVLAASTAPLDVASAAQWTRLYPTLTEDQINVQPWAPAVKVLVHYPTVLQYLGNNVAWTQQLGSAFAYQPADVMASVQRLRVQAQLAGSLYPTAQQQVFVDNGAVRILPASPEVIYVPQYDPAVVYVRGVRPAPIAFSAGFSLGGWLDLNFDWGARAVFTGFRWNDPRVIRDHVFVVPGRTLPRWEPDPRRVVVAPRPDWNRPDWNRPGPDRHDDHRGFDPHPGRDPGRDERRGHDSMRGRDDRGGHDDHDDRGHH